MMTLKILIFALIAVITLVVLIHKTGQWSVRFRQYMLGQANRVFGSGSGWDKRWALLLSKIMVVFFGLMFVVFAYVVIFSI